MWNSRDANDKLTKLEGKKNRNVLKGQKLNICKKGEITQNMFTLLQMESL
jgi:phage regulator Rha-like protein